MIQDATTEPEHRHCPSSPPIDLRQRLELKIRISPDCTALLWRRRRDSNFRSMKAAFVGTRWFATLKALQTSNLRFTRVNTGFRHQLIPSVFVARVSRHGESTAPSRIKTIFRFRPGPGCPTKNPHKAFTSCLSCSSLEEIGRRLSHTHFSATATAIHWFKDTPSFFARRCAAFLIDVGSFNGYVALLMLSPSSADRPHSAPKSGFG